MSPSMQLVRPSFTDEDIDELALRSSAEIAMWTLSTAQEMGISAIHQPHQEFVRAVSRLSDGVVDLDPIEELLVALCRADVLTTLQTSVLQFNYLLNQT